MAEQPKTRAVLRKNMVTTLLVITGSIFLLAVNILKLRSNVLILCAAQLTLIKTRTLVTRSAENLLAVIFEEMD